MTLDTQESKLKQAKNVQQLGIAFPVYQRRGNLVVQEILRQGHKPLDAPPETPIGPSTSIDKRAVPSNGDSLHINESAWTEI